MRIISAELKMGKSFFEKEKAYEECRKKNFVFVKSYENFDLYQHKKARLL